MALRGLFADQPVNVSKLASFRAEHFPYSGPYPWLDQPDAMERIEQKLSAGELSPEEAGQCRGWASNGYIIVQRLFAEPVMDEVWGAYERAVSSGRIKLEPEPASEDDPYPGRF